MALFLYPGRVSFSAPTLSNPLPQGEVGAQRRVRILIQRVLARLWNSAVLLFQMMSEIEKSIEIAQLNGFVFSPSSDRSLLSESRPTASSCGVRRNVSDEPSLDEKPFRLLDKVGLFFTFDSHTVAFPYHGRLAFPGPTSRQFPHEYRPYSYPPNKKCLEFPAFNGFVFALSYYSRCPQNTRGAHPDAARFSIAQSTAERWERPGEDTRSAGSRTVEQPLSVHLAKENPRLGMTEKVGIDGES
jgi:hypothetical protein